MGAPFADKKAERVWIVSRRLSRGKSLQVADDEVLEDIVDKSAYQRDAKVGRDEGCGWDESKGSDTPNPFTQKGF